MSAAQGLLKAIWKGKAGYFFIAPGYFVFLAFTLAPILFAIQLSFYNTTFNINAREFIGIDQYLQLTRDPVFKTALMNTIRYTFIIVPATILIALIIALRIDPLGTKSQALFRGAFYIPGVAGGVVLSVVFLWIFNPTYGLLNYALGWFGIAPVMWLASAPFSFYAVCMVVLTFTIGQPVILLQAGLAGIGPEIMDAAMVDGANSVQKALFIRIPLLRPVLLFVLATQTIQVFQLWEVIYMVTGGGPFNSSTSLVYLIFQRAFIGSNYGIASAMGVVLMVIILIFTLIQLRLWDSTDV